MTVKRLKPAGGFTLVEIMVATVILSVAVIGASGYRYYAALDARKAAKQANAARVALLLCESWRGAKGSETYDPIAHLSSVLPISVPDVMDSDYDGFIQLGYVAELPLDFTVLGSYRVVSNDGNCYPILAYKDTGSGLRVITVVVVWPLQGRADNWYPSPYTCKVFRLTTYTPN